MPKFIKTKTVKPEEIAIGQKIEVHADSLATFKAYVSKANKDKTMLIRFNYSPFVGSFCTATRKQDEPRKQPVSNDN
jgi:uncharacterized FAD-dependent dehydrogenase